ncbi:MAG: hypothetical protein EXR65_05725 [Dehalococcoidia bacterium]|nr:hypothetical protein [Dehalococcoidia bacterium]
MSGDAAPLPALLTAPAQVAALARRLRDAGRFAIDLEFVPEDRYAPELALVQVGWGDARSPEVAAIDPLAVDPRPVLELIGVDGVVTIAHSAQGDLAVVSALGISAQGLRDTQIAAAFLGFGDQIGYGPLVQQLLGVHLSKQQQFTEWLRRPLSDAQLAYALDDVRYLPALWARLSEQLEHRGRLRWVDEECARLAGSVRPAVPEEAYRRIKGGTGLGRSALGALRALAAWRQGEAQRANLPPSRVVPDHSLLALARSGAHDREGLLDVRGVTEGLVRRYGAPMLAALREGVEHQPPPEPRRQPPDARAEAWAAVLQGLVRSRATAAEVAARFVATRDELDALAEWWLQGDHASPPPIPLLEGWRRELVGAAALEWLAGTATLSADPDSASGLRLGPLPRA